jgi:hypothetical protein
VIEKRSITSTPYLWNESPCPHFIPFQKVRKDIFAKKKIFPEKPLKDMKIASLF